MKPIHWKTALFTFARFVLNVNSRMLYPFLTVFARGMGVSLETISLVITMRSFIGALNPLFSTVSDRHGRRAGMLLGSGVFSAGLLLAALVPTFPAFFVSQCICIIAMFLCISSMQAYLGDEVPYAQRGRLLAVVELGWSSAFILGMPLVGAVIAAWGWHAPFPILAALSFLITLLLWRAVPAAPRRSGAAPGVWRSLRGVFTHPQALAALAVSLSLVTANELVSIIFGVWMEQSFGMKIAGLGAAAAVIGAAEFSAEFLTAWLVDRLGKQRSIRLALIAMAAVSLALPALGKNLPGALFGLFLFYFTSEIAIVSTIPLMSEILPAARATLLGSNTAAFSLGRALGASFAIPLYTYGFYANAVAAAILVGVALLALGRVRPEAAAPPQPEP